MSKSLSTFNKSTLCKLCLQLYQLLNHRARKGLLFPWATGRKLRFLPFKENSHGRAGNRTRDLMIRSQRLWPLDHEAGQFTDISALILSHGLWQPSFCIKKNFPPRILRLQVWTRKQANLRIFLRYLQFLYANFATAAFFKVCSNLSTCCIWCCTSKNFNNDRVLIWTINTFWIMRHYSDVCQLI